MHVSHSQGDINPSLRQTILLHRVQHCLWFLWGLFLKSLLKMACVASWESPNHIATVWRAHTGLCVDALWSWRLFSSCREICPATLILKTREIRFLHTVTFLPGAEDRLSSSHSQLFLHLSAPLPLKTPHVEFCWQLSSCASYNGFSLVLKVLNIGTSHDKQE